MRWNTLPNPNPLYQRKEEKREKIIEKVLNFCGFGLVVLCVCMYVLCENCVTFGTKTERSTISAANQDFHYTLLLASFSFSISFFSIFFLFYNKTLQLYWWQRLDY